MKFKFSIKDKEALLEADVERLVEKRMDGDHEKMPRKTRYQIRQEEKRKNEEMMHKHQMQWILILLGMTVFFIVFGLIMSIVQV